MQNCLHNSNQRAEKCKCKYQWFANRKSKVAFIAKARLNCLLSILFSKCRRRKSSDKIMLMYAKITSYLASKIYRGNLISCSFIFSIYTDKDTLFFLHVISSFYPYLVFTYLLSDVFVLSRTLHWCFSCSRKIKLFQG